MDKFSELVYAYKFFRILTQGTVFKILDAVGNSHCTFTKTFSRHLLSLLDFYVNYKESIVLPDIL